MKVIGRCSICGGQVVVPLVWYGTVPPTPECSRCGAVAAPSGPVIPMVPRPTAPSLKDIIRFFGGTS